MKLLTATALSLAMSSPVFAQDDRQGSGAAESRPPAGTVDIMSVSPALQRYTMTTITEDLWRRPGLSPRDRSVVTLATLIARGHAIELPYHVNLALDNGVTPAEISEIITHLAFYSGWGNAIAATDVAGDIFKARGITADQLPPAEPELLPLDPVSEEKRATAVQAANGAVSQSLVDYTGDVLFKDLWLRPDLAPRDRSLVTVSALIASGQVAQVTFHLNRAMDNGLTQAEASEVISPWPSTPDGPTPCRPCRS